MDLKKMSGRTLLTIGAAASTGLAMSRVNAATTQPNMLWIITDDQPRKSLVHMDKVTQRIAGKGIQFTQGYAAVPLCGPARASMLTSMNAHRHGCVDNHTLPRFRDQGHDRDTVATRL